MTKANVICKEDCDNSPKKRIIRDYKIAAANGDTSFIVENLADDVAWQRYHPGHQSRLEGKEALLENYEQNRAVEPREVIIEHILTHGKVGSANGVIKARDGATYVFSDVYVFSSHAKDAPIKEMTSYIIEVEESNR